MLTMQYVKVDPIATTSMTDHGLSNEFVVSTSELFNKALQVTAWTNVLLLYLHRVNNCGRQNGASFDCLIESGMLMKLGCSIVRAADFHPLATTV